jgi:hypothetical protein
LWSIRTTATKPTGETPFFLVYGAEAVLPTDVKFGSPRVLAFDEIRQEDLIKDRLLLLEEARCQAALCTARYQQGLCHYHSRHVRARTLEVGDLVLRRILPREGLHKLSPMWEGHLYQLKLLLSTGIKLLRNTAPLLRHDVKIA